LDIDVKELVKIDDIFDDGDVKKRLISKGNSTARADNTSEVFLNFRILNMHSGEVVYSTLGEQDFTTVFTDEETRDFEGLRNSGKCFKAYLDEYRLSRTLKNVIRRMKKHEKAEVMVRGDRYVKYGRDYEELKEKNLVGPVCELRYEVVLYSFTEDKNGFTMNISEKMFHAQRKKEIALQQYNKGNYKKSLKLFETINSYFDLGTFSEADKENIKPLQLSSLLNTSLILTKTEKWKQVIIVANKILKLDPVNIKAVFRKATALRNMSEFEDGIRLLINFKEKVESNAELKAKLDLQSLQDMENLLKTIKQAEKEYLKTQKNIYSSMFSH